MAESDAFRPPLAEPDAAAVSLTGPRWRVESQDEHIVNLRRDGAAEPSPGDWRDRLARLLRMHPDVGVVGAKRLAPAGTIHSMGDFVVHSKGFHHLGKGLQPDMFQFPEEADAVTGGVAAVDRAAFEQVGGVDAWRGELGALASCLAIRRAGGRCVIDPSVTVVDDASPAPKSGESTAFEMRFGFDWRAADLDRVRADHACTGLLWNHRVHADTVRYRKYQTRPNLHWVSYRDVAVYRSRADAIVGFIQKAVQGSVSPDHAAVLDFGCGDGLFSQLLAGRGLRVTGVDIEPEAIEQATAATAESAYPAERPVFQLTDSMPLPFDDGAFDGVAMIDVIEHLPNPVGALRELRRLLRRDGVLCVVTPEWQYGGWSDAVYHYAEYTHDELRNQLDACGFTPALQGRIGRPYRDVIVAARRLT